MTAQKRREELDALLCRAICAGDTQYAEMTPEAFEAALGEYGGEDFYECYARQRAIGADAYRREIAAEIAGLQSPQELHYLIDQYNFDDPDWALWEVLKHPLCDLSSAVLVYWAMRPCDCYGEYGGPALAPDDPDARLMLYVEERAAAGGFVRELPPLSFTAAAFDQYPDYARPPCDAIPPLLRLRAAGTD